MSLACPPQCSSMSACVVTVPSGGLGAAPAGPSSTPRAASRRAASRGPTAGRRRSATSSVAAVGVDGEHGVPVEVGHPPAAVVPARAPRRTRRRRPASRTSGQPWAGTVALHILEPAVVGGVMAPVTAAGWVWVGLPGPVDRRRRGGLGQEQSSTVGPSSAGSQRAPLSTADPCCQPSATETFPASTSNTRPVTSPTALTEPHDQRRHVLRRHRVERRGIVGRRHHVGEDRLGHAGAGRRGDGVGGDAVAPELGRLHERERGDAGLGRAVGGLADPAEQAGARRRVDDAGVDRLARLRPLPPVLGREAGAAKWPLRWTRMTASHSSSPQDTNMRSRRNPALLTTTSSRPNVSTAVRDEALGAVPVGDVVAVGDRLAAASRRISSTTSPAGPARRRCRRARRRGR